MKKILIITLLVHLLSALLTSIAVAQQDLSSDKIKEIIKREVDNKRSISIVVGIVDEKGKQVMSYGKLKNDGDQEPDGNTLYEIGSITKVFTSLLLAKMSERGELSLDDPIAKFLPKSVKTPTQDGKEITLLNLSTQTSGLPRLPDNMAPKDPNNPYADYTIDQMYDFLSRCKLTRGIGEKYEYSNYGVGLLGHILALKAGLDYETLVRTRICEPLKMNSTVITLSPELRTRLAVGHDKKGKPVENWDFPTLTGAGALRSSVNDMLIFAAANLGLIRTGISSAMETTHHPRDTTGVPGLDIAMGWHIWKKYATQIVWHNGGTGGYRTFIGLDKKSKRGVVVLSNSTNSVDDIGLHLLESKFELTEYHYKEPIADTLMTIITQKGIEAAIRLYRDLKREQEGVYNFHEDQLNTLGYQLQQTKKVREAIEIFKLNVEAYPKSSNVYDSIGEAYMVNGDKELAIANYQKSLDLNPSNTNGINMLEKLKGK